MTQAVDRRAAARHGTVNNRTKVELMDWSGLRIRRARLVNFSSTGALILTDQTVSLHQPLRVRLENAPEIGWIPAVPVRFGRSGEVGIRFARPFPLYFLSNPSAECDSPLVDPTDDPE